VLLGVVLKGGCNTVEDAACNRDGQKRQSVQLGLKNGAGSYQI
jgi:hypothetical protein